MRPRIRGLSVVSSSQRAYFDLRKQGSRMFLSFKDRKWGKASINNWEVEVLRNSRKSKWRKWLGSQVKQMYREVENDQWCQIPLPDWLKWILRIGCVYHAL